jgi:hypothetical protein
MGGSLLISGELIRRQSVCERLEEWVLRTRRRHTPADEHERQEALNFNLAERHRGQYSWEEGIGARANVE